VAKAKKIVKGTGKKKKTVGYIVGGGIFRGGQGKKGYIGRVDKGK
jgi:hypothetical protein